MFNIKHGDLIKSFIEDKFDAIAHGCNCYHTMGAGIAYTIANRFPAAQTVDSDTEYGSFEKLGYYSRAITDYGYIFNMYTQHRPGRNAKLEAIKQCFVRLNREYAGFHVGIPAIGCGIGGLELEEVIEVIKEVTPDVTITLVLLSDEQTAMLSDAI